MLHRSIRISYSEFIDALEAGNISAVTVVDGRIITGNLEDAGQMFETEVVASDSLWQQLRKHNVAITFRNARNNTWGWWILILVLGGLFIYLMVQQQQLGDPRMMFSESKARFFPPGSVKHKFSDVAGLENAKDDLGDIIDFLRDPEKFKRMGAKVPAGILFTGEPGNGKTLLAKALAGEANSSFFYMSGSDFLELYVGVGAARVRSLFAQAKKHAPSIIFIDELDAIGRKRSGGNFSGAHHELENTLNALLVEMDGFETSRGSVILIGATNRPDVLDNALTRPGRFDRRVEVPFPDVKSRRSILEVHAKGVALSNSIDFDKLARSTVGFSGAQLENLINESVLHAIKKSKPAADMDDFEYARDKIMMGAERKTLMMSEHEKKMTSYHEAGHTLLNVLLKHTDPLHKVTIMPRGRALGLTHSIPEKDKVQQTKNELLDRLKMLYGGYLAEEIVFKDVTSGASNDIEKATEIARRMVTQFGMSPLGTIQFDNPSKPRDQDWELSEQTKRDIDAEVRKIIESTFQEARVLLMKHRSELDLLALTLLDKETLSAEEVYKLLGRKMPKVNKIK